MTEILLGWAGQSKNGNSYLRLDEEIDGFFINHWVKVTPEKMEEMSSKVGEKIKVPTKAIS